MLAAVSEFMLSVSLTAFVSQLGALSLEPGYVPQGHHRFGMKVEC